MDHASQVTDQGLRSLKACRSLQTLLMGGETDELPGVAFEETPKHGNKVR